MANVAKKNECVMQHNKSQVQAPRSKSPLKFKQMNALLKITQGKRMTRGLQIRGGEQYRFKFTDNSQNESPGPADYNLKSDFDKFDRAKQWK